MLVFLYLRWFRLQFVSFVLETRDFFFIFANKVDTGFCMKFKWKRKFTHTQICTPDAQYWCDYSENGVRCGWLSYLCALGSFVHHESPWSDYRFFYYYMCSVKNRGHATHLYNHFDRKILSSCRLFRRKT